MSRARGALLLLAAPVAAAGLVVALAAVVLAAAGVDPWRTLRDAFAYGLQPRTLVAVVDKALPYYLAGIAAAVGFHLRLFNIGIDGQYRLAAFAAAVVGAAVPLPGVAAWLLLAVVAAVVGAAWASLAGWLFVRRGVNVVISTILLNQVATGVIAYLLATGRLGQLAPGSNNVTTSPLPEGSWIPSIPTPASELNALLILAVVVGGAYWWVLNRTTVGFEVRALGLGPPAARVAGMQTPRLAFGVMAISGAVAGLVGLPQLLGASHHFGLDFPAGLGFTGLSVAILGRNHPVGVAVSAFAWAFIERSAQVLDLAGVSKEVVTILQAVIVLSIVVAYEAVGRWRAAQERRFVAASVEAAA